MNAYQEGNLLIRLCRFDLILCGHDHNHDPPLAVNSPRAAPAQGSTESASFGVFPHFPSVLNNWVYGENNYNNCDCDSQPKCHHPLSTPLGKVRTNHPPARQPSNPAPKTRVKNPRSGTAKGRVPWEEWTDHHTCMQTTRTDQGLNQRRLKQRGRGIMRWSFNQVVTTLTRQSSGRC